MKFTQPCLLFVVDNKEIDWAMLVGPGENMSRDTAMSYCDNVSYCDNDKHIYGYPVLNDTAIKSGIVNELIDSLSNSLKQNQPLDIPGVFEL